MIWKYSLLKAVGNKNDSLEQLLRSFTVTSIWKITHGGWNTKKKHVYKKPRSQQYDWDWNNHLHLKKQN